jgi:hypothetical protein
MVLMMIYPHYLKVDIPFGLKLLLEDYNKAIKRSHLINYLGMKLYGSVPSFYPTILLICHVLPIVYYVPSETRQG